MNRLVLLLLCCCSLFLNAQRVLQPGTADKSGAIAPEVSLTFPAISLPISEQKAILDTFLAPAFTEACALAPAIIGTDRGGFVTGTNGYLDIAKLQRINFTEAYDFDLLTVSAALILDEATSAGNLLDDVMIVAKVYQDNANGTVGDFLGDSDSLRIGDLNLTDSTFSFNEFNFSTPISFTQTESIIVGVDFINVYGPGISDLANIGIVSTSSGCGNGNNIFDVFLDSLGNEVFLPVFQTWDGLNIEMYMSVVIDREPAVATRNPVASYGAFVSPNPATDQLKVTFTTSGTAPMTAALLSTDGRKLREQAVPQGAGLRSIQWNVEELPAGVYLYQLAGPRGVETGRVVVR